MIVIDYNKENGGYISDIINSCANPENQIVKSNSMRIEKFLKNKLIVLII